MQAYGRAFARVYNMKWGGFADRVAPRILDFYQSTTIGQENKSVLDLCCGTGQLAVHFLDRGYRVTGIDSSGNMLYYARENAGQYLETGQARFVQGDAANFTLDGHFGLVVSIYDSLNHLEDEQALRNCFQSVFPVLVSDGFFIFDLNTRAGLMNWNQINITDTEEMMMVSRGIYDEQNNRAYVKISGFVRASDGLYERFDQTAFNTAFEMEMVKNALLETGWRDVHFARVEDLTVPVAEPEKERRAFIVARK